MPLNYFLGTLILGPLAGVGATVVTNYGYRKLKQRNQAALLSFGSNHITFVYPPRRDKFSEPNRVILPRTATEDFLAINNFISALIKCGWKGNFDLCKASDFIGEKRNGDVVFICSPASNTATREVLDALTAKYPGLPTFVAAGKDRWALRAGGQEFSSETYDVVDRCRAANTEPEEAEMRDHGLLIKAANPWSPGGLVFVLAGIRGLGTWGIAECLKKQWKPIYEKKRKDGKHGRTGPFAAIIEVAFKKCDLTDYPVKYMVDLD